MAKKNFNLVFGQREMFRRRYKQSGVYVSLADRGWDGEVEVLDGEDEPDRKSFGRIQGKKKRQAEQVAQTP